jgi:hypothetical protein
MRSTPGDEEVPSYAAHFTSSRKGAHTARRHAAAWLAAHGCPDTTGTIALVVADGQGGVGGGEGGGVRKATGAGLRPAPRGAPLKGGTIQPQPKPPPPPTR